MTLSQNFIVIKSPAWAWGFEDGYQGRNEFTAYDRFCGQCVKEYLEGWRHGRAVTLTRHPIAETATEQTLPESVDGAPDAVSELDLMAADLTMLRLGLVKPVMQMDPDELTEIEEERIGTNYCERPYDW